MKCLAVTNSHPAELLKEADAIVSSLEEVTCYFYRTFVFNHCGVLRATEGILIPSFPHAFSGNPGEL